MIERGQLMIPLIATLVMGCMMQPAPAGPTPPATAGNAPPPPTSGPGDDRATAHDETVTLTVPDFTGKTPAEVQAIAHKAGFEYEVEVDSLYTDCEDPPKPGVGKVDCQKPKAGEVVKRNAQLYVTTQSERD